MEIPWATFIIYAARFDGLNAPVLFLFSFAYICADIYPHVYYEDIVSKFPIGIRSLSRWYLGKGHMPLYFYTNGIIWLICRFRRNQGLWSTLSELYWWLSVRSTVFLKGLANTCIYWYLSALFLVFVFHNGWNWIFVLCIYTWSVYLENLRIIFQMRFFVSIFNLPQFSKNIGNYLYALHIYKITLGCFVSNSVQIQISPHII